MSSPTSRAKSHLCARPRPHGTVPPGHAHAPCTSQQCGTTSNVALCQRFGSDVGMCTGSVLWSAGTHVLVIIISVLTTGGWSLGDYSTATWAPSERGDQVLPYEEEAILCQLTCRLPVKHRDSSCASLRRAEGSRLRSISYAIPTSSVRAPWSRYVCPFGPPPFVERLIADSFPRRRDPTATSPSLTSTISSGRWGTSSFIYSPSIVWRC